MEAKNRITNIYIPCTVEAAEVFESFIKNNNSTKRAVFDEMLKNIDKITIGERVKRGKKCTKTDHYKTIMDAWNAGDKRKRIDGKPYFFADDLYKYFISTGKSEGTAKQYCIKKIPQNPIYAGLAEGWLAEDGDSYVITPAKAKTLAELLDIMGMAEFKKLADRVKASAGEEYANYTNEQKDAAYVAAYYEEASK